MVFAVLSKKYCTCYLVLVPPGAIQIRTEYLCPPPLFAAVRYVAVSSRVGLWADTRVADARRKHF